METKFHAQVQSLRFRQGLSLWERWHRAAMTERASPLKIASAVSHHDPTCEKGAAERPQTFRCSKIKNTFSANYAQSERGAHSKSSRLPKQRAAVQYDAQRLFLQYKYNSVAGLITSPS